MEDKTLYRFLQGGQNNKLVKVFFVKGGQGGCGWVSKANAAAENRYHH